jgi:hypothetical protein
MQLSRGQTSVQILGSTASFMRMFACWPAGFVPQYPFKSTKSAHLAGIRVPTRLNVDTIRVTRAGIFSQ